MMMTTSIFIILACLFCHGSCFNSFISSHAKKAYTTRISENVKSDVMSRRKLLPLVLLPLILSDPCNAVIEGNPIPAKKKALSEEYMQGTSALANMDSDAPIPREAYKKLPSGVIYADLREGSGETVKVGSRVNLQW